MTTENIDIRVSEDGSRVVRRRLDDIADGADRAQGYVDRMNSVLKMVGKYLAVTEVMKWADAWSVAASSIKIATSNSFEFVQVQTELFKIAQRSRQEFGALAELYAAVARQSENLKTSQKGLLLYTENISKALAVQHTSMAAARGPLLQLGQAMASGKIRAQEFNSIMLGLPYVMKIVAENFKGGAVSVMQLRQMMLKGKLESVEFYEAFQRGSAQINKDFNDTQVTFSQAFTIFRNELVKFTGTMDSTTGASAKFAAVLKFVAENLTLLASASVAAFAGIKFGPVLAGIIATRTAAAEAAAAMVAANVQIAASENLTAIAALESARATVGKTQAELANVAATQAAILVSREASLATLAKANSDVIAARASIQAATNAGALSYALAIKREAEVALTAAEIRRSAALSELAVLGQQQARVTAIQTEATAAHAAAVRALTVAQGLGAETAVAYGLAQTGAAAATSRIGLAAGAATLATRVFSGAVALMGGPIGVAITALALLVMWLFKVKSKADDARAAIDAVNRVNDAKNGGAGVRKSDAEKIQAAQSLAEKNLDDAQDKLAALEKNIAAKRAAGNNSAADAIEKQYGATMRKNVSDATAEVEKYSRAMEDAKDLSIETGGAAGKQAREISNARSAWEQSNKSVKTATGIQEAYTTELDNSRKAYKEYVEKLKSTNTDGINNQEIERANKLQIESEISMAKSRDAALKALANKGAPAKAKAVQLEVDERMSIISSGLENELQVRTKQYDAQKRILDAKHQNGILSESQFMAENLQMVQRYETEERAIIERASNAQKAAYDERRAYIQKTLSGKRETDELTRLDAEYAKFVDSTNAKLENLNTSAFERQSIAIAKLSGELKNLSKQDAQYWSRADANADKEEAVAEAKRKMAFATEEQQAAYEAYMRTGEQHNAQLERLQTAYDDARREADKFSASIDWREAGADTIAVLEAMNNKAEGFSERLSAAYGKLDELKNRAAASAAEAIRNKEYNKNVADIADSIETAIFEGGKAGGKKFTDWLKNYFLRNPLKVLLQGTISMIGNALGFGGGAGAVVGGGGYMDMASNASNAYSLGSRAYGMYQGGFGGTIGGISFGSGTGAGAAVTGVNGLSALTPVTIGTNASAVTGVTAGGSAAGGGMSGMTAFTGYAVIAGLVLNALGAFKSDRQTGAGFQGTLGGVVTPYEEWRTGGSLFSGPSSRKFNPLENLTKSEKDLQKLKDTGQGDSQQALQLQKQIDALKAKYGDLIISAAKSNKILQDAYDGMRQSVGDMADSLGLSSEAVRKFTIDLFGDREIELKGLTPAEQQAKFAEALATANNDLAEQVLGTWVTTTEDVSRVIEEGANTDADTLRYRTETNAVTTTRYVPSEFARDGEKAIDTLIRLSSSLAITNKVFDTLGHTAFAASLAGGDLASKLIDLFGGADAFVAATNSYYESYYTEEERKAIQTRQVTEELKKYNIAMPKSRDEFRKLVESQDLTTEEGRKMYHVLMMIAPAFAEITTAAEDAAAAMSVLEGSTDKAFASLEASINKQIAALEASKAPVEARINALNEIFAILDAAFKNLIGSIDSTVAQSYTQGRAYLDAAAANPSGVGTLNKDELNNAVSGVSGGLVTDNFKTKLDYDRERLTVAGQYDKLRSASKDQLTVEEQILAGIDTEIGKLSDMLKMAQLQLDTLRGIDNSVLSVADAILRFQMAWAAENLAKNPVKPATGVGSGGPTFGPGGAQGAANAQPAAKYNTPVSLGTAGVGYMPVVDKDKIERLDKLNAGYHAFDGTGDVEGLNKWIADNKVSVEDRSGLSGLYESDWRKWDEMYGLPKFANGGSHAGGLRMVGERGWEVEATGASRIWNQSQLGSALAMGLTGQDDGEEDTVSTGMAMMSDELENIKRVSYNFGRSQTVTLRDMLKLMRKNDTIGQPPVRSPEDA